MGEYKRLWWTLIIVLTVTFAFLGFGGVEVYKHAPPIPNQIVTQSNKVLMTKDDILNGQTAWQSTGGMQVGSIWGHGAYQAPDWTADWLHRELLAWLDLASQEKHGMPFGQLDHDRQAALQYEAKKEFRANTYDEGSGVVTVSDRRAMAIEQTADHYMRLYGNAPELQQMRDNYAMKENTLPSEVRRKAMTAFFFWTSWAASTERPGTVATYTNNWPPEPLVDNFPTTENVLWSLACVIILIAGTGFLVLGWSFLRKHDADPVPPEKDPITQVPLTPSQKAVAKYLLVVVALFGLQILLGGFTAHYTIEGQHFYGIDVSQWFPYSLTRTWHLQLAIFWIATAFLAVGLFLGPVVNGGKDPKYQVLGVNVLFGALIVVVVGTLVGNFLAIKQVMPENLNFWLGHQGYEYLDLGRIWQLALFIGIVFWLGLMLRVFLPALKQKGSDKNLLALLVSSTIAIGLFYGTGLFYGERTNISIMEYWRWWVVHLWVEGIFEVFATTALAFVFSSMGLVSKRIATASSLAAASLFMVGGVPGTFHHLYFSGTTTPIMAIGAAFSALEVVPLILLGYEAWEHWSLKAKAPWMEKMKWPLMCFVAVAFWNMVGAGIFGFMINTPIALFYLQGLNTTAVHAHAALFGVYGFLAIGFVLLVLRYIRPNLVFSDKLMGTGFWWLNIGLCLMILTSLLPVGLFQFEASVAVGMWYARSDTFLQQGFLETLRWIRTIGDVVFIVGGFAVIWQVIIGVFHSDKSLSPGEASIRTTGVPVRDTGR
ncbi:MAG: nitric-oxide reductase large subunit [Alcaligenaceae bacterium]|nr:nitric-oxide reductase large subunit [Alcaligenaceae bacterium]